MEKLINNIIYILSAPIQSGKTTSLMNWVRTKANIKGILTPDIDGLRMVYNISDKTSFKLIGDGRLGEDTINIGRFSFSKDSFERARMILDDSYTAHPDWLVIDEIGKLEIEQKNGLEPSVSEIIRKYQNKTENGKLLLVIRDYLLSQSIEHYHLEGASIIQDINQLPWNV